MRPLPPVFIRDCARVGNITAPCHCGAQMIPKPATMLRRPSSEGRVRAFVAGVLSNACCMRTRSKSGSCRPALVQPDRADLGPRLDRRFPHQGKAHPSGQGGVVFLNGAADLGAQLRMTVEGSRAHNGVLIGPHSRQTELPSRT